jgi:hypothetical protein
LTNDGILYVIWDKHRLQTNKKAPAHRIDNKKKKRKREASEAIPAAKCSKAYCDIFRQIRNTYTAQF